MYKVFIARSIEALEQFVECCNEVGDEIVSVTQYEREYTVIYKLWKLEE